MTRDPAGAWIPSGILAQTLLPSLHRALLAETGQGHQGVDLLRKQAVAGEGLPRSSNSSKNRRMGEKKTQMSVPTVRFGRKTSNVCFYLFVFRCFRKKKYCNLLRRNRRLTSFLSFRHHEHEENFVRFWCSPKNFEVAQSSGICAHAVCFAREAFSCICRGPVPVIPQLHVRCAC